jgi:hypothetical protein
MRRLRGLSLAERLPMHRDNDDLSTLENAFSILRFRRRGVVSFREFTVLTLWPIGDANDLPEPEEETRPLRVVFGI